MEQKFSLQNASCLGVSTPTPSLPRHSESRHMRLFLFKAQGVFRWNVKVYLLILSHFKVIQTPKTRIILTETVQICRLTGSQNYVSRSYTKNRRLVFQAIQIQGKNHEFHATHMIKFELKSVLSCSTAYATIRETSSFESTSSPLLPATHCLHALRSSFFSLHQSILYKTTFFQMLHTSI